MEIFGYNLKLKREIIIRYTIKELLLLSRVIEHRKNYKKIIKIVEKRISKNKKIKEINTLSNNGKNVKEIFNIVESIVHNQEMRFFNKNNVEFERFIFPKGSVD